MGCRGIASAHLQVRVKDVVKPKRFLVYIQIRKGKWKLAFENLASGD
jgi:hypothetical protein